MKKLITILGSCAITASTSGAIATTSINLHTSNKIASTSFSDETKLDHYDAIFTKWLNSLDKPAKTKAIQNLKENVIEKNGVLKYNIAKLDVTLFNPLVLEILSKVSLGNLTIEQFKTMISDSLNKNEGFLNTNLNSNHIYINGWKFAIDYKWWSWITGFFYMNFNSKLSSDIAGGLLTTSDLAGIVSDAMGGVPDPITAAVAAAAAILSGASYLISKIFNDNDHGNGVWIGAHLYPPFLFWLGWGSSGHNW